MGNDESLKKQRNSQSPDSKPPAPEDHGLVVNEEHTHVDLGEDLLAPTVVPVRPPPVEGFAAPSQEDQYESARILINEGFVEDAKKLLRRIMITDPDHAAARQSLQEILDRELKDLLVDRDSPIERPRLFERKGKQARGAQQTSDDVLRELDQVLDLGLDENVKSDDLKADLEGADERDLTDLGVAFMEMGLYGNAVSLFEAALVMIERKADLAGPLQRNSTTALLVRAHIAAGNAYGAIQILHPVIRDAEIIPADKIEFLYLMGLAYEKLGRRKEALPWYVQVRDIDPQYRDIAERLRKPAK